MAWQTFIVSSWELWSYEKGKVNSLQNVHWGYNLEIWYTDILQIQCTKTASFFSDKCWELNYQSTPKNYLYRVSFLKHAHNWTINQNTWAVCIMVLFLIVGGCPYPNMDGRRIAARLQEGYRMPKPSHVDGQLWVQHGFEVYTYFHLSHRTTNMKKKTI